MPRFFSADIHTSSFDFLFSGSLSPTRSHLLLILIWGIFSRPRLFRIWSTSLIFWSWSGSEQSATCKRRSADCSSSKVALKDSISSVGKSDIKPTVSENKIGPSSGSTFLLVTESSVANSLSAAYWLLFVSLLKSVVFPALV